MQNFSIEPIYNGQKDVQNQYYYTYTLTINKQVY